MIRYDPTLVGMTSNAKMLVIYKIIHSGWILALFFMKERVKSLCLGTIVRLGANTVAFSGHINIFWEKVYENINVILKFSNLFLR